MSPILLIAIACAVVIVVLATLTIRENRIIGSHVKEMKKSLQEQERTLDEQERALKEIGHSAGQVDDLIKRSLERFTSNSQDMEDPLPLDSVASNWEKGSLTKECSVRELRSRKGRLRFHKWKHQSLEPGFLDMTAPKITRARLEIERRPDFQSKEPLVENPFHWIPVWITPSYERRQ